MTETTDFLATNAGFIALVFVTSFLICLFIFMLYANVMASRDIIMSWVYPKLTFLHSEKERVFFSNIDEALLTANDLNLDYIVPPNKSKEVYIGELTKIFLDRAEYHAYPLKLRHGNIFNYLYYYREKAALAQSILNKRTVLAK